MRTDYCLFLYKNRKREYSVQTEKAVSANATLKREREAFQNWFSALSDDNRICVEKYLNTVENVHFQKGERAYYHGMVDTVQIFMELGIVKKRDEIGLRGVVENTDRTKGKGSYSVTQ